MNCERCGKEMKKFNTTSTAILEMCVNSACESTKCPNCRESYTVKIGEAKDKGGKRIGGVGGKYVGCTETEILRKCRCGIKKEIRLIQK